jgi:hypothetical protein
MGLRATRRVQIAVQFEIPLRSQHTLCQKTLQTSTVLTISVNEVQFDLSLRIKH